jgi:hypothetical protein
MAYTEYIVGKSKFSAFHLYRVSGLYGVCTTNDLMRGQRLFVSFVFYSIFCLSGFKQIRFRRNYLKAYRLLHIRCFNSRYQDSSGFPNEPTISSADKTLAGAIKKL